MTINLRGFIESLPPTHQSVRSRRWAARLCTLSISLGGYVAVSSSYAIAPFPALVGALDEQQAKTTADSPAKLSLASAVVIGASVSDGFDAVLPDVPAAVATSTGQVNFLGELGGGSKRIRFADTLGAMANADGTPLRTFASSMFFFNASGIAEGQLKLVREISPPAKLIVAIDYLFWHAYGAMPEEQREKLLRKGLERLDGLLAGESQPVIVIADLPNMSHAVGKMLTRAQVPSAATLEKLNMIVADWAKGQVRVVQVPLSSVVKGAMAAGEKGGETTGEVILGGRTFKGKDARNLLTWDGLHASYSGQVALANETLEALIARKLIDDVPSLQRDEKTIHERIRTYRQKLNPSAETSEPAEKAPKNGPTP